MTLVTPAEYDELIAWLSPQRDSLDGVYGGLWRAEFTSREPIARTIQLQQAKVHLGFQPERFAANPKYGLVLADPPWPYDQFRDSANGAVVSAYDPAGMADIYGLRVGDRWAAKNCVLVLWITGPMLVDGHLSGILREWGFRGRAILPWLKNSPTTANLAITIGVWVMACAEYVVFATRGKIGGFFEVGALRTPGKNGKVRREVHRTRIAPPGALVGPREEPYFWGGPGDAAASIAALDGQAIIAPKVKPSKKDAKKGTSEKNHSKKPELLREYCESFEGPYLELFARTRRSDRWSAWGYELGFELGPEYGVRAYKPEEKA